MPSNSSSPDFEEFILQTGYAGAMISLSLCSSPPFGYENPAQSPAALLLPPLYQPRAA